MINPLAIATNGYLAPAMLPLSIATDGYLSGIFMVLVQPSKGEKKLSLKELIEVEEEEILLLIKLFMVKWHY